MGGYWFHFAGCIVHIIVYKSQLFIFYFWRLLCITYSAACFSVIGIFSIKVQDFIFLLSRKLSILYTQLFWGLPSLTVARECISEYSFFLTIMVQGRKILKPDKWQADFDSEGRPVGFQKALKTIIFWVSFLSYS